MPAPGISPVSLFMPGMAETQVGLSNIERQRALAQALQQQSLEPIQGGASQGPLGAVTAPISWTQGLAKLMQGYVGGKSQEALDAKQLALIKGLSGQYSNEFGSDQAPPAATSPQVQSALSNTAPATNELGMQSGGPGPTVQNAAALDQLGGPPTQTQGRMQIPGMSPGQSKMLFAIMGPQEYGKVLAKELAGPAENAKLRAAGVKPESPEGVNFYRSNLLKENYIAPASGRPGGYFKDPITGQLQYLPKLPEGVNAQFGQNGNVSSVGLIPGVTNVQDTLGTSPMEKVQNADQTFSYVPKRELITPPGVSAPVPTAPVNNPGNLRPVGASTGFQQFASPQEGLAAIDKNLQAYGAKGINTLEGIISRWAPPSENNTAAYIADASKRLGVDPKQQIDLNNPAVRQAVGTAIMLHEQGPQKLFSQTTGTGVNQPTGGGLGNRPRFGQTQAEQVQQAGQTESVRSVNKGQADLFNEQYGTAVKGVQTLPMISAARQALDSGAVTGFGAPFFLNMNRALSAAGFRQSADATQNTQIFAATTARQVLQIIKNLGSGSGISDADREYASKIIGGDIALDAPAIRRLLQISDTAIRNQAKWVNDQVPKYQKLGADVSPINVEQFSGTMNAGGNAALEAALAKYK